MAEESGQNTWMGVVDPEFAPIIPATEEAFKKIWTYDTIEEFRGNWTTTRANYAAYIPTKGFTVTHRSILVRDNTRINIRLHRPELVQQNALTPVLFVMHGGGTHSLKVATTLGFQA